MPYKYKQFYRRKLPHRHSPGATLFVTFRLSGSIPKSVLAKWKAEKDMLERKLQQFKAQRNPEYDESVLDFHRSWFRNFEEVLDKAAEGPIWLKDERVAKLMFESLLHRNGKVYRLDAFCIMSNHIHVVFMPFLNERSLHEIREEDLRFESDEPPLSVIMHSLKSYTAQQANKILQRTGSFWEEESYDREIRDETEYHRTIRYVLNNPVKAGLVKDWRDWRWSWKRE